MQFLITVLIFFLPTQLGKHFFFEFSYINGVRVDYLAPTFFFIDIFILALLVISRNKFKNIFSNRLLLVIVTSVVVNVFFSLSKEVSLYRWVRLFEVLSLFYIILQNKKISFKIISISLFLSTLLQCILVVSQFISKHSIEGIFYYLGERAFTLSTPGIAKASLNGVEFLRPYGTFSHPNSLAGFYLIVYFFVLKTLKKNNTPFLHYSLLLLSSILIFLSFSKVAIITFLILNISWLIKTKFYKDCIFCFTARIAVLGILAFIVLTATTDIFTVDKRWELVQNSIEIIKTYPLGGVGLGNYVIAQKDFPTHYLNFLNQPVHNIFLLLLVELGIPLVLLMLFFLKNKYKHIKNFLNTPTLFILLCVGITGLFDHYWLTLFQNSLAVAVFIGLSQNRKYFE